MYYCSAFDWLFAIPGIHKRQSLHWRCLCWCVCISLTQFACSEAGEQKIFDGEHAYQILKQQCDFGPRDPGSIGHRQCLAFLENELRLHTSRVHLQKFKHYIKGLQKIVPLTNIIASFAPIVETDRRMLLCAHWDTRPWADMDPQISNRGIPILGANDGASGVAVLVSLARIFAQDPPPVRVDIVLFDGEDAGIPGDNLTYCLGSQHFAKSIKHPDYERAVLLDMVGDADQQFAKERYSAVHLQRYVDHVWDRAAHLGLTMFTHQIGPEIFDDHRPLIDVGIPCINIIDFDYAFWHTVQDTPDKCRPASLQNIGDLLIDLIYTMEQ